MTLGVGLQYIVLVTLHLPPRTVRNPAMHLTSTLLSQSTTRFTVVQASLCVIM